ncbi:TPA: hypothetical protein ACQ2HY_003303 [Klebsiella pneumoniae]
MNVMIAAISEKIILALNEKKSMKQLKLNDLMDTFDLLVSMKKETAAMTLLEFIEQVKQEIENIAIEIEKYKITYSI